MLIKLTKPARINHAAGETVEVSPDQARFLIGVGSAELVPEKPAKSKTKPKEHEPLE